MLSSSLPPTPKIFRFGIIKFPTEMFINNLYKFKIWLTELKGL